ncbi:DUF4352 domain-containing protein [Paenibacillus pasadenensis]|uniref:DUF4352 domain-containing protein n=1 Tax=Paenibacillus pasadenensis TaxID=217090 RepID=UPI00203F4120|nr:DUF4352 domain-containing protein [Paenibacillus pasadenensis]MCM3746435.1 DUF4352 domain-containing protein [Paenibacillus pasadenensis]
MKKGLKMFFFGLVGLLVVLFIIGSMSEDEQPTAANESSEANKSSASPSPQKDKATTDSETAKDAKEEAPSEEPKLAKIGEELQVGDVVFKVNKVKTTKEVSSDYFSFSPDSEGAVFLIVNVTVTNKGKDTINTDSSFFKLIKDDIEYSPSTLIGADGFFLFEAINPGLAQSGNVAFEIPETLKDYVLNVQTGFWGTEQGQINLK